MLQKGVAEMKGITKIELFDEKGNKTNEVVSENLVTLAAERILNPYLSILRGGTERGDSTLHLRDWYKNLSPLAKTLYGGLLLFGTDVEQDEKHVLPTPTEIESLVGYAGQGVAELNNPYRGTYNSSESGAVENGYKHVWDFTSEQAIGTIKTVCLTTMWGGEQGWKAQNPDLTRSIMGMYGSNLNKILQSLDTGNEGDFVPSNGYDLGIFNTNIKMTDYPINNRVYFQDGYLYRVGFASDYTTICVRQFNMTNKFTLGETIDLSNADSDYINETTKELTNAYNGRSLVTYTGVDRVCYAIQDKSNKSLLHMVEVKIGGMSIDIKEHDIEIQDYTFLTQPSEDTILVVDDNFIYTFITESNSVFKFSRTSSAIAEEYALPEGVVPTKKGLSLYNGMLVVPAIKDSVCMYYLKTPTTWATLSPNATSTVQFKLLYPYYNAVELPLFINETYLAFFTACLCTINVLSTAVTKTSSKSMKVSYTLINS